MYQLKTQDLVLWTFQGYCMAVLTHKVSSLTLAIICSVGVTKSGALDKVKNAVLGFFSCEEIAQAKDTLWSFCGPYVIGEKPIRKDSPSRSCA